MNTMKRLVSFLAVVAVLVLSPNTGGAVAQQGDPVSGQGVVGTAFTYQGQLIKSGAPITSTCDFQFGLWDAATVGNLVSGTTTQTVSSVAVTNGYFTASPDFGAGRFDGNARWLAIQVQCTGDSSPTLFTQRQALTPAPYALTAIRLPWGASWSGAGSGTGLSLSGGDTGFSGTGTKYGVAGYSGAASGTGLLGYATNTGGNTVGVTGRADSTSGTAVNGWAASATGSTYGVVGRADSTAGVGVMGYASATSGNTYGLEGQTPSTAGVGVVGSATATSGATIGVQGIVTSTSGIGVVGSATAVTGGTIGVQGTAVSTSGVAVSGWASATSGSTVGVQGRSDSASGDGGVFVNTNGGVGLAAWSPGGNIIEGYGSGYARYFYVTNGGEVYAHGSFHNNGADYAELLPASAGLKPGDLLAIGPDGKLEKTTSAYQASVAGVYSTKPGVLGGAQDGAGASGKVPLAVVGVVPVKVSAENGAIKPGDLLTASNTPGNAMKATPITVGGVTFYPSGVIIGKALESLASGSGVISVLVTLQ